MARKLTEKEQLLETIRRAQSVNAAAEELAEELAEESPTARKDNTGL